MIYFTADLHFNHNGIIGYCGRIDPSTGRPFASAAKMNEVMIERWNAAVHNENDEVWVLGDFGFSPRKGVFLGEGEELDVIFHRLRGRKSLVVGNHDEKNPKGLKLPWERQEKLFTFKGPGGRAELCHYPLESWKGSSGGALMFHGHSHGALKRQAYHRFDVGVDVYGCPQPWDYLLEIARKQPFKPFEEVVESGQQGEGGHDE